MRRIAHLLDTKGVEPGITIGIRKNSRDWPDLWRRARQRRYVMTSDWSNFDGSVPAVLLRQAWQVILYAFSTRTEAERNYLTNLTNLYENNFVNGVIYHAGYAFAKNGSIPSGSIMTSLIGSIVNYIVMAEMMRAHPRVTDFNIWVYGDDALIAFDSPDDLRPRDQRRAFLHKLSVYAKENFGMTLSTAKTEVGLSEDAYYKLVQPQFSEPAGILRLGTRNLKPVGYRAADDFNFIDDYENGWTHRATYDTRQAVHFLGKSCDKWGRPIMSTFDTIVRMINPEHSVTTITDAIERCIEYAVDNPHNRQLTNQLKYVYLALSLIHI